MTSQDRSDSIPITRNVVLITGFRQRAGRKATGMDSLWWRLHSQISEPGTVVWLRCWNDDFQTLAEQIDQYRKEQNATIDVVAYSWGVGYGAMQFARALQGVGLSIRTLFSIDGVYRSNWLMWRWRALLRRRRWLAPKIVLPRNIRHVVYWRQDKSIPQGHRLVQAKDSQTRLTPGTEEDGLLSDVDHLKIDEAGLIHDRICYEIAQHFSA